MREEGGSGQELQPPPRPPLRAGSNPFLVFGIAFFVAAAFYASLVVASRADVLLFPGHQIRLNLPIPLPGVEGGMGIGPYGERLNILVLGLDRNLDESPQTPSRTDTIFVVTIDTLNQEAAILSFPRDLVVEIPDGRGGYIRSRINTAYPLGMVQGGPEEGVRRIIATLEYNFGIRVDRYVVIDFRGFQRIIDLLGGIDVMVEEEIWDPKYILPSRGVIAHFRPGLTHMDGEMALAYSRIRVDSDLKRIQRQHRVMRAVMDKVLSLHLLTKALPLWREYKDAIETNIQDWEVPGLALLALRIGPEEVATYSLGEAVMPYTDATGASLLRPLREKVQAILREVFYDPRLRREGARVGILDGSGDPRRLQRLIDYLVAQGLPEASIVNGGSGPPSGETTIFNLNDKGYTAEALARWLGLPRERIRGRDEAPPEAIPLDVDILLLLGPDLQLP